MNDMQDKETTEQEQELISDNRNTRTSRGELVFVLMGIGLMLPLRCILTSLDFYILKFKEAKNIVYITQLMIYISCILAGLVMIFIHGKMNIKLQIFVSLIGIIIASTLCPIISNYLNNKFGLVLFEFMNQILGALKVVGQQSILAYASMFTKNSQQYQMNFLIGVNLSGVIAFILRLIVLALLNNSLTKSQYLYTTISLFISVSIIVLTCNFYKSKESQQAIDTKFQLLSQNSVLQSRGNKFLYIIKKSKINLLGVFLNMFITISLFPSIVTKRQYPNLSISWNQTYLTGNFEVSQVIGSIIAKRLVGNNGLSLLLVIIRFTFLGLFLKIVNVADDSPLSQYWVAHFLTFLLAASSGYLTNCFIIQANKQYESQIHKKLSNYMSLFFFFLGSFAGTLFGILYLNQI